MQKGVAAVQRHRACLPDMVFTICEWAVSPRRNEPFRHVIAAHFLRKLSAALAPSEVRCFPPPPINLCLSLSVVLCVYVFVSE